jgi:hypothetical protein
MSDSRRHTSLLALKPFAHGGSRTAARVTGGSDGASGIRYQTCLRSLKRRPAAGAGPYDLDPDHVATFLRGFTGFSQNSATSVP